LVTILRQTSQKKEKLQEGVEKIEKETEKIEKLILTKQKLKIYQNFQELDL